MEIIVRKDASLAPTQRCGRRGRGAISWSFLDNDCALDVGYWKELEAVWPAEVQIVGGPALLRPQATAWEEIFPRAADRTP